MSHCEETSTACRAGVHDLTDRTGAAGGWFTAKIWAMFQNKDHLSWWRDLRYKDKTVSQPSYLYEWYAYAGKMTLLYWGSPWYDPLRVFCGRSIIRSFFFYSGNFPTDWWVYPPTEIRSWYEINSLHSGRTTTLHTTDRQHWSEPRHSGTEKLDLLIDHSEICLVK